MDHQKLKARIDHDAYVIDPRVVAEALLRQVAAGRAARPWLSRPSARGRAGAGLCRR